jgi:hypothetical protein
MSRPIHANTRKVFCKPSYMENAKYKIWINDEFYVNSSNVSGVLYEHECSCDSNQVLKVKIKLESGRISFSPKDGIALYPITYGEEFGYMETLQDIVVDWMKKPTMQDEYGNYPILESGDVLEYYHLIPNGPEWFEVYFGSDVERNIFLQKRYVNLSISKKIMVEPKMDYYPLDQNVPREEREKNLLKHAI